MLLFVTPLNSVSGPGTSSPATVAPKYWYSDALPSCCPEIRRFAEGVHQDEAAVSAALTERWSNDPVEGQVNRLKLIKRSGYGRAGFRLLRARVLNKV